MRCIERYGIIGLLISAWQYLSHLLWQHSPAQLMNAYVVAVVSTAVYAASIGTPLLVCANAVLGLWLLLSTWILPRVANATLWNNVLVGAAMLMLAATVMRLRALGQPHDAMGGS